MAIKDKIPKRRIIIYSVILSCILGLYSWVIFSPRGGETITCFNSLPPSTLQITSYAGALRSAIFRMVRTGISVSEVDFTSGVGKAKVFSSQGGGAFLQTPTPAGDLGIASGEGQSMNGVLVANTWGFKDARDAEGKGYYIKGVGLDTDKSGREILAYLHDISLKICNEINKGLGLGYAGQDYPSPQTQSVPVDFTLNSGKGAISGAAKQGIGSANVFAAAYLNGNAFACIKNGDTYDYYHALAEQ